jgi:uncharacterized RDD family membrane protein YckC
MPKPRSPKTDPASIGRRATAAIIDVTLGQLALWLPATILFWLTIKAGVAAGLEDDWITTLSNVPAFLGIAAWLWLASRCETSRSGQTPGKHLLNIKVQAASDKPSPSRRRAWFLVTLLTGGLGAIGLLLPGKHRRRTLHDARSGMDVVSLGPIGRPHPIQWWAATSSSFLPSTDRAST